MKISQPVPGLRLITLPLPFEMEHVNVGLVTLNDGYMLIDAGLNGERSFRLLTEALEAVDVKWTDVRIVFATHIHPDHFGGAPRAVAESGAQLLMHHAEFEFLNAIVGQYSPWMDVAFTEGGVPREVWDTIRTSVGGMRRALTEHAPDRLLDGGETIPTAIGDAVAVATPGHSAGHLCLYWAGARLLYAGDHLIQNITPNIAWMPGRDMLGTYLDSLDVVDRLDVNLVVSSHGEPFGQHHDWISATRRHHRERCDAILRHISAAPRTAYDLIPLLWEKNFSSFQLYFALFEVMAHLEYMRRRGEVGFEDSSGPRQWFSESRSRAVVS